MRKIIKISRLELKSENFSSSVITVDGKKIQKRETAKVVELISLLL